MIFLILLVKKVLAKVFFGNIKDNDDSCIVIHLDTLFQPLGNKEHNFSNNVRNLLIKNLEMI